MLTSAQTGITPPPTTKAIIDGALCDSASGKTFQAISPIDGSVLAYLPDCDENDINRAVAGARKAFTDRRWAGLSPKERKRILMKWAELVAAEADELAVLQCRDMGMGIELARNLEIANAVDSLRWYAEATDKIYDELANIEDCVSALISRVPLGVIGCILPWNAPAMIGAWKLGPALLTGNSVVLKPAEDASLVCLRMAELALAAGLPHGVLQVVTGDGSVAGAALSRHMDVDCITFTGSGEVGREIMVAAARSNLKRVSLELGGKSANIVMNDASNLDFAADVSVNFMFGNQGQVCEAPTRLLVQRSIRDAFLEKIVERTEKMKVGNPLNSENQLGPIINAKQRDAISRHVERALQDGAQLLLDGRGKTVPSEGFYLAPSIALVKDARSTLAQTEIFGPVLTVLEFNDIDEAIRIANATRYGLGASIWSDSLDTIMYASKRLVAGNINVNGGTGPVVELPFGGFKESGFGRDRSLHAIDKYCDLKNVILRTSR